jgi:hypothetical protein
VGSEGNRGTHGELEEVVGAEAREVEAADVTVVVLAADLPHVAVAVGAHELVELLPDGVHGAAPGAGFPSRLRRGRHETRRRRQRRGKGSFGDWELRDGLGWE